MRNNTPVFSGTYPVILNRNEEGGTQGGTLLHTLTATDADITDVIAYSCTFNPSNSSTLFTYSSQTGTLIGHPSFTIGDEDMNEVHTWAKT
ncbi:hypothetical protein CHS0354_017603 [Potamilus streckersoni]|uniref:Uncharacterized protein n=1 Tax=Potamilus streckersoni TaxID=2493646 RepID=A0AAE0RNT3_9BIVA|nr:hypothetical protein CHS0354_017603 [Potamilus streckersoni]